MIRSDTVESALLLWRHQAAWNKIKSFKTQFPHLMPKQDSGYPFLPLQLDLFHSISPPLCSCFFLPGVFGKLKVVAESSGCVYVNVQFCSAGLCSGNAVYCKVGVRCETHQVSPAPFLLPFPCCLFREKSVFVRCGLSAACKSIWSPMWEESICIGTR